MDHHENGVSPRQQANDGKTSPENRQSGILVLLGGNKEAKNGSGRQPAQMAQIVGADEQPEEKAVNGSLEVEVAHSQTAASALAMAIGKAEANQTECDPRGAG